MTMPLHRINGLVQDESVLWNKINGKTIIYEIEKIHVNIK